MDVCHVSEEEGATAELSVGSNALTDAVEIFQLRSEVHNSALTFKLRALLRGEKGFISSQNLHLILQACNAALHLKSAGERKYI